MARPSREEGATRLTYSVPRGEGTSAQMPGRAEEVRA